MWHYYTLNCSTLKAKNQAKLGFLVTLEINVDTFFLLFDYNSIKLVHLLYAKMGDTTLVGYPGWKRRKTKWITERLA